MTNEKLYKVLGDINEKHVKEARECRKVKKPVWLKWGAMAACLCLVIIGTSYFFTQFGDERATDIEPRAALTLEEAARDDTFGKLFPTWILEDYVLEDSVGIFNNTVLEARFYSETYRDELVIQIGSKEWFYSQHEDLELNTVLYRETTRGTGSRIYIDGGDYIILYSFGISDLKNNRDFLTMATSAAYFQDKGGNLMWFGDKLIDSGHLSESTLQWLERYNQMSKEEQAATSYIPIDLLKESGIADAGDTEVTQ